MFYSHQLLARKAPLGQIWMAATMHAKINRRKLDKLDIIKICEEILNPSVPMALRLSGILMGGVVIVYERKVKLLYEDVTRFLIEINEAWKVKAVADSTVLPKGKTQAKYEAITLPANIEMDVDQEMFFSGASATAAKFQHMRLEDLDEFYININPEEENNFETHHQAEAANITLVDNLVSGFADTDFYNHYERFDIGDEENQMSFTPQEQPQVTSSVHVTPIPPVNHAQGPTNSIPSSPPRDEPLGGLFHICASDNTLNSHQVEEHEEKQEKDVRNDVQEKATENRQRRQPRKRKGGDIPHVFMDNEQIMIPGSIYQSWLQDASNIISKRGRRTKPPNPIFTTKVSSLMDLPPVALISGLDSFTGEVRYPAQLMELWRNTRAKTGSGNASPEGQQNMAPNSLPERSHPSNLPEFPREDIQSHIGSQSLDQFEKLRANLENMNLQRENEAFGSDHFDTPGSPVAGQSSRSYSSSGSAHNSMQMEPEIQLTYGRSKRKQHSSSRAGLGTLDPVEEDIPLQQNVSDFKIRRLSEDGPTPDFELLEETGPTQTPQPRPFTSDPSADRITQAIRTHLKLYFDTPGGPGSESLNNLASNMDRRKAALLFYQTCVLATSDFVKVEQTEPYGDISLSRGLKM